MIGKLFKGDAMEQLSDLMEKGIAKYDKIVKDLHVSFIRFVERTWGRITDAVSEYWQASMRRIEPTLMQFLHYMESMVWSVSKEVFGEFCFKYYIVFERFLFDAILQTSCTSAPTRSSTRRTLPRSPTSRRTWTPCTVTSSRTTSSPTFASTEPWPPSSCAPNTLPWCRSATN